MVVPAVGPQVSSTLASPPRFGFGTGSRFHDASARDMREHRAAMRKARGLKPEEGPKTASRLAAKANAHWGNMWAEV